MATSVPSTLTAFLLPYVDHYRRLGWTVHAASNGVESDPKCKKAFGEVHNVPWTRKPSDLINFTTAVPRLQQVVREGQYDLVHVHDPIAAFLTRFSLRRFRGEGGVSVVYTAHGFHFYEGAPWPQSRVFETAERLASRWTDRLIVINREDFAAAQSFGIAKQGHVVYMPGIGVDLSKYDLATVPKAAITAIRGELGLAPEQKLFSMIAEFNPGKRHRDAVEALARSGDRNSVLAFAGVGPLMEAVAEQARALGVESRVRFLGYRDDIPVLIAASLAVMLPSEREGLPRCLMEASCMERPVIASRIRGVSEVVTAESGILHGVGDIAAISSAMDQLLADHDLAIAMGLAGRREMHKFDIQKLLESHDELYAELLGRTISL